MKKLLLLFSISTIASNLAATTISCKGIDNVGKYTNVEYIYNPLLSTHDELYGTSKDFTLIMENDDFAHLAVGMNDSTLKKIFPKDCSKLTNVSNTNWLSIFKQLENKYKSASIADGYVGILNVQNNQVMYSNVTPPGGTSNATTNIKTYYNETYYSKNIRSFLPTFSFNENGQGTSSTNKIALNKSYLNIFKDMKSKNANWNSNSIEALLKTDNFQFSNSKPENIAKCIYNLFNNKNKFTYINKILNEQLNKDVIISFDSNNKYLNDELLSGEL